VVADVPEDTVVLYEDERDFGCYSSTASDWSLQNCQEKVRTRGQNRKRYLFGARDAQTGQLYLRWAGRKNGATFVLFLKSLRERLGARKLLLILDNFAVHKCRRVQDWLAETHANIQLLFLPTYSPWLNAIENDWRIIKRRAHNNTWSDATGLVIRRISLALLHMGAVLLRPRLGQGSTSSRIRFYLVGERC